MGKLVAVTFIKKILIDYKKFELGIADIFSTNQSYK